MDCKKGDINNQGKEEDRIMLHEDGTYCYPCETAKYEIMEFGSVMPQVETGMVISQVTGIEEYDPVIHKYIGCGQPKGEFQYSYIHRVRVHPIGYNYDNYDPQLNQGLNGIDYYIIDEILETKENPNSIM